MSYPIKTVLSVFYAFYWHLPVQSLGFAVRSQIRRAL